MPISKQILIFNKQVLFSFLFLLISACRAQGQQVVFNSVSQPGGSFPGIINGISQDSLGYMWFTVYGHGLYRSDGYHLVPYQNDPKDSTSLASNEIEAVYADRNGIIWVGTQISGLDRLDPNTGIFTHFPHKTNDNTSLSDNRVTAILEDHEGTIWVGTMNGLNRLDQKTGTFTRYEHKPNDTTTLSWNQVQVLYEDRRNTLWVGTASFDKVSNASARKGGLNRFNKKTGKFTQFSHHSEDSRCLIDNRIGAIFEDSKGTFWICTAGDGLHTMDRATGLFERYQYNPAHPEQLSGPPRKKEVGLDMNLFFIQEDGAGAIWIGASGGWITRYDLTTKKVTHYDSFNEDAQSMKTVSGAFTSREGILWITTWVGNIYQVDPFQGNIQHFNVGSIVHAIHEDASGAVWLGTLLDGLIRHDRIKGSIDRFSSGVPGPSTLKDLKVDAFYEENDSTLWIGSKNVLYRYNRKTQTFTPYTYDPKKENSLSKGNVVDILEDKTGSLWIATSGGLDLFDIKNGIFKNYRNDPRDNNSLSHNEVTSLLKDRSGNLWIGTYDGTVNLINPRSKKFKHFRCGGIISSIAVDHENIIWVGTTKGLYKSNPGIDSFSRFTDPRVAMTATTIVTAIIEDNQKNLWMSSSAGILRFNSNRSEISVYNKSQGVDASGISYFLMRGAKGRRGEFFFADKTGYYAFFPDQFKTNPKPPQIVISDFRLADQSVKPGKSSPLRVPLSQTKEITLGYNQNFFSFDFVAIHYSSPEDNQHFFRMENLDNGWQKAGLEKTAYYYNVPPGQYIFRVKATNSNGKWAEKAITVIITPPWWSNWWFRIASVVCMAALFYALIRWRVHQKFRLQLERSEKEKQLSNLRQKTAESEMQALRAQMNPHFIFNCLSSINRFILKNESEAASDYLTKFSRLMRMVLNNSQKMFINLDDELEMLRLYLDLESLRFKNSFNYAISFHNHFDASAIFIPPLLLQPFAENAIWHGLMNKTERGNLEIGFELENEILNCYITDNGVGRRKAEALKSKSAEKQKSMGMQITAGRLALLNKNSEQTIFGIEDLADAEGQAAGTRVTLKIKYKGSNEDFS